MRVCRGVVPRRRQSARRAGEQRSGEELLPSYEGLNVKSSPLTVPPGFVAEIRKWYSVLAVFVQHWAYAALL